METKIKIKKLDPADRESILKIADWYYNEWGTPIDKTLDRLTNQPNKDTLFQLVLKVGNEIVASGGLCNRVNIFKVHERLKKFKPWIGLLYTHKHYRNRGFGTMLLNQIEHCAKEKHIEQIYLYTFTAKDLYKRCGWKEFDRVLYKGHQTAVMRKKL